MSGEARHSQATPPDGDELRAAEYVLGVLERDERIAAASRIETDAGFRERVERWQRHFHEWLLRFPRIAPPSALRRRVEATLDFGRGEFERLVARSKAWRWLAAASIIVAAGAAAWAWNEGRRAAPRVEVAQKEVAKPVVVLRRGDGTIGWLASVDAPNGKVYMVPVPSGANPAGFADELWIRRGAGAPISLGFVSNVKAHTIALPPRALPELEPGATLAISLESESGIPHRQMSDRVVATGSIADIR